MPVRKHRNSPKRKLASRKRALSENALYSVAGDLLHTTKPLKQIAQDNKISHKPVGRMYAELKKHGHKVPERKHASKIRKNPPRFVWGVLEKSQRLAHFMPMIEHEAKKAFGQAAGNMRNVRIGNRKIRLSNADFESAGISREKIMRRTWNRMLSYLDSFEPSEAAKKSPEKFEEELADFCLKGIRDLTAETVRKAKPRLLRIAKSKAVKKP